jgi:hypothetical protein
VRLSSTSLAGSVIFSDEVNMKVFNIILGSVSALAGIFSLAIAIANFGNVWCLVGFLLFLINVNSVVQCVTEYYEA